MARASWWPSTPMRVSAADGTGSPSRVRTTPRTGTPPLPPCPFCWARRRTWVARSWAAGTAPFAGASAGVGSRASRSSSRCAPRACLRRRPRRRRPCAPPGRRADDAVVGGRGGRGVGAAPVRRPAQRQLPQQQHRDEAEQRDRDGVQEDGLQRVGEGVLDDAPDLRGQLLDLRRGAQFRRVSPDGSGMPADRKPPVISSATRLVRIAPNAATPIAPPRLRKNETPDVVDARSAGAAAFCAARMRICRLRPIPTPRTARSMPMTSSGESVCSRDSRYRDPATHSIPITGKIL